VGALADYVTKKFGRPTRNVENPMTSTVGTTPTQVLQNNPDRFGCSFTNLSPNDGFVGWFSDVSATKGVRVAANGGWVHLIADEDGEKVGREFFAINLVAAGTWFIEEIEAE